MFRKSSISFVLCIFSLVLLAPPINASKQEPTCDSLGLCSIGDIGPGGGLVFFYRYLSPNEVQYFEVAPNNWQSQSGDPKAEWCLPKKSSTSERLPNVETTSDLIGDGAKNTKLMLKWCRGGISQLVNDYQGGNKKDWFIPSFYEAVQLCKFSQGDFSNVAESPCALGTRQTGAYAFDKINYWTSSAVCDSLTCYGATIFLGYDIIQSAGYFLGYREKYLVDNPNGYQRASIRPVRSWVVKSKW